MKREAIVNEIKELVKEGGVIKQLFCYKKIPDASKGRPTFTAEFISYAETKDFSGEYQKWYSKCLFILKIVEPQRLDDFESQYRPSKNRKQVDILNYTLYDAICGVTSFSHNVDPSRAYSKIVTQVDIIKSLELVVDEQIDRIENELQIDVFDQEIDSARELLKNKYYRSAGAVCGVILERHLKIMAAKVGIVFKKDPTLNDYNQELYKAGSLNSTQFKFISFLSDIRNKCDHAKTEEPAKEEIEKLIAGTDEVVKTY